MRRTDAPAPAGNPAEPPAERSLGIARTIAGLVTNPEAVFRQLTRDPPLGWAAGIIVVAALVYGLDASLRWGAGQQWMGIFLAEPPPGRLALGGLVAVPLVFVVLHPLLAGLLRGVAALLGGRGSYRGLLAAYAFALLPSLLSPLGALPTPVSWLGTLFVFWAVTLIIRAVRVNEQLSWLRSCMVAVVPMAIPGLVSLAVLLLA